MSLKNKLTSLFHKKSNHYSVYEMCGISDGYDGAKNDAALVKKIRGWAWTCIDRNAKACAQVPIRLYTTSNNSTTKGIKSAPIDRQRNMFLRTKLAERVSLSDNLVEITDHPIIDLLRDVNPNDNSYDLKEVTFKYLDAIGVDYWWLERGVGEDIINIWPLKSQNVEIILTKDETKIKEYKYTINNKVRFFKKEDVVHFKTTSLTNPLKGDSPTKAGEESIDLNEAMNQFEIASFKNGGNPSMVMEIPTDSALSPDERKRIYSDYKSNIGSVKNTGKLFIGSGGAKIHEYGHSPKEMSFLGGRASTQEEIFGVYGVPTAFAKPTDVSRDNFRTSLQVYMQFTINPRLVSVEQKLNEQFTVNWGDNLFLLFDDATPVDSDSRLKEIETHLKMKYSAINEERAKDGLEAVSWGDEPVPETTAVIDVEEPKETEKAIDVVVIKREGETNNLPEPDYMPSIFRVNMTLTFKKMEAEVIKGLKAYGKPKAIEDEASDAAFAASADDIVSSVYNQTKWADEIAAQAQPFIRGLLTNGLVEAMEKVKPDAIVNASSPAVLRSLDERAGQIRSVAATVQDEIRDDIAESIAAGESKSGTIKRVRDQFDARFKADRVVRTETIWAHNEGTVIAWEQSDVVKGVRWDTVPDDRRCKYCAKMDGKTKTLDGNWFNKGESLTVTSDAGNPITLKFDYEPIVHPPLHPNCRCQIIPIISD